MSLSPTDIRASGLLELYAIGELAPSEYAQVAAALDDYPELRQDLASIEHALEEYAFAKTIPPNARVLDQVLEALPRSTGAPRQPASTPTTWFLPALAAAALVFLLSTLYLWRETDALRHELRNAQATVADCLTQQEASKAPIATLNDLQRADNDIVPLSAAEQYPSAEIFLYNNSVTGRNYLAINDMPALLPGQIYQLWALKPNDNPLPLDIFDDSQAILPVASATGSIAYAITIEQAGGATVPNLAQLIGSFPLPG